MTPKEKKWTQLLEWVNNNTCFTGKDVLDVIRAIDDSFNCDYDVTKICLTCVHRVTVGHEPYCDDPNSGWGYHGKTLRCERWKEKDKNYPYKCFTCKFYRKDDMWCTNYNSELRGIDGCSEWRYVSKDSIDLLELNRKVENIGLWNREFQKMIFALMERVRRLENK